jgi:DNA-binding response OmpR family regulator
MTATVHIADANRHLCDLYRQFFSHHGWQVQISAGGLECLDQLRQSSPVLLILDWHLPWGGADGLLAVMREDPQLARIPVILTTSEATPEASSGGIGSRVVRVIRKPFSLATLHRLALSELSNGKPGCHEGRDLASPPLCS